MPGSTADGDLTLVDATVWPDPDSDLVRGATVVIRSGTVTSVTTQPHRPRDGVPVVDLAGRLVTAGWWNCHVHLTGPAWARAARIPAADLQCTLDDMLVSRGFTGAVDLGSNLRDTLPVISRLEAGELRGVQLFTAAAGLYPPRGLPFYLRESLPRFLWWPLPTPSTARGARRVVERQLRRGASVTKLFTGSYVRRDRVEPMGLREATAATAAAHAHGALVFAHPSNLDGLRVAVEAGVDVLAHVPSEPHGTEPLLREAARRGMWLIPTLDMFARTVSGDPAFLDPIDEALRLFLGAGGRLLFGTDVGYMPYHAIDGELAALERCGLSAADVLRSLTTHPARALGLTDVGTVRPGNRGDLTVLDTTSCPRATDLADVALTVQRGHVVHSAL